MRLDQLLGKTPKHLLMLSSAVFLAAVTAAALADDRGHDDDSDRDRGKAPLIIKEQGSFFVGGEPLFTVTGNDTSAVSSRNPGTATINQSYVEYQVPVALKSRHPMIMLPGGGHEGKVYETTPEGREGWATYFVRRGFAVYNSDGVNRGASSWDMTNVALAAQNNALVSDIPAMNRYTHELAWTQFRIGPALGVQNPAANFPWKSSSNTPVNSFPLSVTLLKTTRMSLRWSRSSIGLGSPSC